MMRIADIEDVPLLMEIMHHKDVAPFIGCNPTDELLDKAMETNLFFICENAGYVHLEPMNDTDAMFHAGAMPVARGRRMIDCGRYAIWLAFHFGFKRANAWIRKDNHRAAMYARLCGLRGTGRRTDYYPDHYNMNGDWYALEAT